MKKKAQLEVQAKRIMQLAALSSRCVKKLGRAKKDGYSAKQKAQLRRCLIKEMKREGIKP